MKSFYLLGMDVAPGGARRDTVFVYRTLSEIQQALEVDLWQDFAEGLGLLYAYGENARLCTFICGRLKQEINLLPVITVRGPGGITFTLNEKGEPIGGTEVKKGYRKFWMVNDTDVESEEFINQARAYVDWSAVSVMPLTPPLLKEGEDAEYRNEGSDETETYPYGFSDMESGSDNDEWVEGTAELVEIDPDWLVINNGAVLGLAESMHKSRNFDAMPVLADALQEAGCTNELFLAHCRAPVGVHAHGSWLVDLLLGKR